MDNLQEINKFLETYYLLRLNQKKTENLNRLITTNKIKTIIKKIFPANKSYGAVGFRGEFYQTFKERPSILLKLFQKFQEAERVSSSFYEASTILIPKPDKDTTKKENHRPIFPMNINAKILLHKRSAN